MLPDHWDELRTGYNDTNGYAHDVNVPNYSITIIEDGAPTHRALETLAWFERAGMIVMVWPTNSPDLNPIENLWAIIKRRLNNRSHRPLTQAEMERAVREEWDSLDDVEIRDIIYTMPARVQAVIDAQGGYTPW